MTCRHLRNARSVAVGISLACLLIQSGCDDLPQREEVQQQDGRAGKQILGVCFMGDEGCLSTYVDLGPYEAKTAGDTSRDIPAYIFPATASLQGGIAHPFDVDGLYNPYRLQNNVFAGPGRGWTMYEIHSANLLLMAEPVDGIQLWGTGTTPPDSSSEGPRPRTRDLYSNPIKSLNEILELEAAGDITIVNLFMTTDCPLVVARPKDIVINLNPNYPICSTE